MIRLDTILDEYDRTKNRETAKSKMRLLILELYGEALQADDFREVANKYWKLVKEL